MHVSLRSLLPQVRSQLEEKEKKFPMFKAVEFKSQVVAGMVFFIKVGCQPLRRVWPELGAPRCLGRGA